MKEIIKRLFGEELKSLMLLNLLTVACSLPIVTIGPALLALNGTLIRIVDDRSLMSRVQTYWSVWKKKFWQGIAFECLLAAYGLMLLWSFSMAERLEKGAVALMAVSLSVGFAAAMVSVCLCLILAGVQMKFRTALWNAVCLAFGRMPRAALAAVLTYGIVYAFVLLYPASILPYLVLFLSSTAALSLAVMWPAYQKYVLDLQTEPDSLPQTENETR